MKYIRILFIIFSAYIVYSVKKNWSDARQECLLQNADLVVIDNAEENQHILSLVQSQPTIDDYYIGLTDVENERIFKWAAYNSTLPNFRYWDTGEPNNEGDEDCVEMRKKVNYKWNDVPCGQLNRFICERGKYNVL